MAMTTRPTLFASDFLLPNHGLWWSCALGMGAEKQGVVNLGSLVLLQPHHERSRIATNRVQREMLNKAELDVGDVRIKETASWQSLRF